MGRQSWRGVESDWVEFVERGSGWWEGWWEGVVWELNDEEEKLLMHDFYTLSSEINLENYELQVRDVDCETKVSERAQDW